MNSSAPAMISFTRDRFIAPLQIAGVAILLAPNTPAA
jgi:hypothetical protein